MTKIHFFRKWLQFLRKAHWWTDFLAVSAVLFLFFSQAPIEIWNSNPATGGDTGSHFFPLVTLVQEGLPNWQVRVWNPGNLGGEPHLTHYFPLPYLIMAFLSLFMPLGKAFNIGTFLPVALFPLSIYFCFRGLKSKFPTPLLAMLASLSFLYNESFSMWGGNILSTLAGQFAHAYAYIFIFLGIGSLNWEIEKKRFPWLSMFMFAGVLLSHFYVALFLPVIFLSFLVSGPSNSFRERFLFLAGSGVGAILLSAWFVVPMIHNAQWNTAFGLVWSGNQFFNEAFPMIFWPFAVAVLLFLFVFVLNPRPEKWIEKEWTLIVPLFFSIIGCGIIFYFIFPKLGLVDVRVIPTLQLSLCALAAILTGIFLRRFFSSPWVWFWTLPLSFLMIWWPIRSVHNLSPWMEWNYSGWESKSAYPQLKNLVEAVKGNFSQSRIIYENSDLSNAAGTMRVFEMLPYFAQRATLESVYMQATILAPEAFYLQALISKAPSCPFPNFKCSSYDVPKVIPYLRLMGVGDLILITPEVRQQADSVEALKKTGDFGNWHLYHLEEPAPLVEVLKEAPEFIEKKNFKNDFYKWFLDYTGSERFLVIAPEEKYERIREASLGTGNCHPEVDVDFNQIVLRTNCPGKFHFLKFAYHSTWEASSRDELYLMSPGFIGLIPSRKEVVLSWGRHWLWTVSDAISWLVFLFSVLWLFRQRWRGTK